MITVKSEKEIELMRESCRIVKETLDFVGRNIRAGMTTKEVDELVYRYITSCGESYHVSTLGGATTCAKCGGKLYQRPDDVPETVKTRLDTYKSQTAPLIDYYRSQGKLECVKSGEGSPDDVFAEICKIFKRYGK